MATHDYVIANANGAAVRADLNNALAAIVSNNSAATEPTTTYAYQWWADTTADQLKLRNSDNDGWVVIQELDGTMLMEDGSAASPALAFADDTNTGIFSPDADQIGFATGGVERLEIGDSEVVFNDPGNDVDFRVESNGNTHMLFVDAGNDAVGLGTSSPNNYEGYTALTLDNATTGAVIDLEVDGTRTGKFLATSTQVQIGSANSTPLRFDIDNSEVMRLDTSGRLLVGTTTSSADCAGVFEGSSSSAAAIVHLSRSSGVSDNSTLGALEFSDNLQGTYAQIKAAADAEPSGTSTPGRITFEMCANGTTTLTERMRIFQSGQLQLFGENNCFFAGSAQGAGTTYWLFRGKRSRTNNTSGGADVFFVYTNGNVQNTNNSYGAISDVKLKENIVDATSQWADLKALQVRKYNFIEGETHTQLGVIAQEVETVSPGLVNDIADRDEEGNDLGTVTKTVNYSVLYMKAVKALQEAMERIETLEAKVAALEAG
jgi:hypothetical protein